MSDQMPRYKGLPPQALPWAMRFRLYMQLIRADRPIGIYLLLWPALWALWIAGDGQPTWWIVLIFVLGTALMRSAGCAINDYADRHIDGDVERTAGRPLATGMVTPKEALGVFVALCFVPLLVVTIKVPSSWVCML